MRVEGDGDALAVGREAFSTNDRFRSGKFVVLKVLPGYH